VFLLTLVAAAGFAMPRLVARVLRPGRLDGRKHAAIFAGSGWGVSRFPVAVGLVVFLMSLGVIRGLPADANARPEIGRGDVRRGRRRRFRRWATGRMRM